LGARGSQLLSGCRQELTTFSGSFHLVESL
jgi:hypothetical protein